MSMSLIKNGKTILIIIAMVFFYSKEVKCCQINESMALRLAKLEASKLKFNVDSMEIMNSKKPLEWNQLLKEWKIFRNAVGPSIKKYRTILKYSKFWVVYFMPKSRSNSNVSFGNDLWVFVDKSSGKILVTIRGK